MRLIRGTIKGHRSRTPFFWAKRKGRKVKIPALIIIIVLTIGGVYAAGPFLALYELRDAVAYDDREKFEKYVDIKAITENLKMGLSRKIDESGDQASKDSLVGSAIGSAIAKKIVGGAVDWVATPEMAMEIMKKALKQPEPKVAWAFANWDRFILSVENQEGKTIDLVLRSDGMSWQIKAIQGLY